MSLAEKHTILYIDDDPDDVQLLQEAVKVINDHHTLLAASNGEEGLMQLLRMKKEGNLPCLVVLDINMPKMDGRQVFKRIRDDIQLASIPVIIFSTSSNPMDKMFFKGDHVEYITKPISFPLLLQVATKMLTFCER